MGTVVEVELAASTVAPIQATVGVVPLEGVVSASSTTGWAEEGSPPSDVVVEMAWSAAITLTPVTGSFPTTWAGVRAPVELVSSMTVPRWTGAVVAIIVGGLSVIPSPRTEVVCAAVIVTSEREPVRAAEAAASGVAPTATAVVAGWLPAFGWTTKRAIPAISMIEAAMPSGAVTQRRGGGGGGVTALVEGSSAGWIHLRSEGAGYWRSLSSAMASSSEGSPSSSPAPPS